VKLGNGQGKEAGAAANQRAQTWARLSHRFSKKRAEMRENAWYPLPMSKSVRVLLVCVMVSALPSVGCRKLVQSVLKGRDAGAGGVGPTVAAGGREESEHDRIGNKLQNYIDCYNQVDGNVARSMSRYKNWMTDPEKGPTGKERNPYGPMELSASQVDTCKKGIPAGAKKTPPLPELEKTGQDYLTAVEVLAPKMSEAAKYYDRKDYSDDKFAKAISMHAPLMASYKSFVKASDAFSDAIESENGKYLDEELKQVETRLGKKLLWHKMTLGRDAKELLHVLNKDTFDVSKAEILVTTFTAHVDATLAYAAAHKEEQPSMWSLYESRTKAVVDAYKERMRRVRDKQPYSSVEQTWIRTGNPELAAGTMAKCSKAYNALVDSGNALKFK
jgi:hypothetical protein